MTEDPPFEPPVPRVATATFMVSGSSTMNAKARFRRGFSTRHLAAAEHFANELRRHEDDHFGAGLGPHFEICTWYGSAAIILSFSAIEAAIDETEDDLGLPVELTSVLDRAPTLDHAQALLTLRGCSAFDRGAAPFQAADLLRSIRNGLVHPKAEWDNAGEVGAQLSRKIVGAHLPLSPFEQNPSVAFPNGCMSAGVATWSVTTARQFIRELRTRLGLSAGA